MFGRTRLKLPHGPRLTERRDHGKARGQGQGVVWGRDSQAQDGVGRIWTADLFPRSPTFQQSRAVDEKSCDELVKVRNAKKILK